MDASLATEVPRNHRAPVGVAILGTLVSFGASSRAGMSDMSMLAGFCLSGDYPFFSSRLCSPRERDTQTGLVELRKDHAALH